MKVTYPKNRKSRGFKNIIGKRFGMLIVVRLIGKRDGKNFFWECKCDCGNFTTTKSANLNIGKTKSCGCLKKKYFGGEFSLGGLNKKDLTGKQFHRLKVLKDSGNRSQRNIIWLCECICGKKTEVAGSHLLSGHTKSCGCYNAEMQKKNGQKTKNFIKHIESIKKYPKEAYKMTESKRIVKYLADQYIKQILYNEKKLKTKDITPEMIEMRRELITYYRLEKELTNGINSRRNQRIKANGKAS